MEIKKLMQSQNFEFLRSEWPHLADLGGFAEQYAGGDPEGALGKLRVFAEGSVDIVYKKLTLPKAPMSKFMELLSNHAFVTVTPKVVVDKLHAVRIHGNKAAHGDKVSVDTASWLLKECWDLGRWLYVTYAEGDTAQLAEFIAIDPQRDSKGKLKREKKALLEKYAKQEARMQALLAELEQERSQRVDAEKSRAELEKAQAKAQHSVDELQFSEAETRDLLIDSLLADVGWQVGAKGADTEEVTQEVPVQDQPTKSGIGRADYVLWDENGKPLAVIEAKKTAEDADKGRQQARLYADGLAQEHQQRPIIFYTNGYDIWIWDDHPQQAYPPRKLYGFYSKKSLQYLVRQRRERKPLNSVSPKPELLTDRLYQHQGLKRICERFEEKQRRALAVQATGTGKTRLAIALSDVTMQAGWVKRVLFLCDRKELRKQAKNAYIEFLSAPVTVLSRKSIDDDTNSIFVATYPGMIKIYQNFDPGFFDLIIADESHRSIYNVYGDLFRYFDALQLGLTATPIEMISRSTCKLFDCDFKDPTCNYPLDKAVEENYLVPFQVVKHTTRFLREGIKGHALTAEEVAELEDQGIDPNLLDFDGKDIDRAIYNKDTNRKILQNLMTQGIRQADEQTLGKSIIFARNHKHAKLLESLFNEIYPQYAGNFCQVIDNYDPRAEQLIDDFKGGEESTNKDLTIAISVDMLDTGIDIPELVNLVFAKPVKSPVKFQQMLGRGTRLCKNLFGPGKDKKEFRIFDHWGVVEYHGKEAREVTVNPAKSLMQRLFEARLSLAKQTLAKAEVDVFDLLAQWLSKAINSLNENTIAVKEKWKLKRQLSELDTLRQFSPNTVVVLETDIAPLMQWVDIRGNSDAYQWDLLITQLQTEKLNNSARFEDFKGEAIAWLYSLKMNLNPVRAKAESIKQARETAYWDKASLAEIEELREDLRTIMKYREKSGGGGGYSPPVIDLKDSGEIREEQASYIASVDMKTYHLRVEQALSELFESNPILKKIRTGKAVSETELQNLNALVHTQHPNVDLNTLKTFYDSAEPLANILRSIVGLEGGAVNQRFADFIQSYPSLSARQVQFLEQLKRQIQTAGAIELSQLYEMPLAALGDLDDLFENDKQIDRLLDIVKSFGEQPQVRPGEEGDQ